MKVKMSSLSRREFDITVFSRSSIISSVFVFVFNKVVLLVVVVVIIATNVSDDTVKKFDPK